MQLRPLTLIQRRLFKLAGVALADDFVCNTCFNRFRPCQVLDFLERRSAAARGAGQRSGS